MTEFVRLRDRHLHTPLRTYVHPDTGRRVTHVGPVNLAEPAYFEALRTLVADRTQVGAVVLCEEVGHLIEDERDAATQDELEVLDPRQALRELNTRRAAKLGWVDQLDGLGYPDSWTVIDLPRLEVIRRIGAAKMLRRLRVVVRLTTGRWARREQIFRLSTALAEHGIRLRGGRSADQAVIIDQRGQVALRGLYATGQDAVMVWRVAHLPGFGKDLRRRGFIQTGESWHRAFRLPSLAAALWGIIGAGRARLPIGDRAGVR